MSVLRYIRWRRGRDYWWPQRASHRRLPVFGALLMLPLAVVNALSAEQTRDDGKFVLKKGQELQVCQAYLERLNHTDYPIHPKCGRPENIDVPGFSWLVRVELPASELHNISENLIGFSQYSNPQHYDDYRAQQLKHCEEKGHEKYCAQIRERIEQAKARGEVWGEPVTRAMLQRGFARAWRYSPPVDIDNDGRPDPILLYHESQCGRLRKDDKRDFFPTLAYVMDGSYKTIDEARTREIFGHPYPEWPKVPHKAFRYIGSMLGIFSYKGEYYFDTFFTSWSDFSNKRTNEETLLNNTLGVFHRKNERTRQVCEFRFND